LKRSILVLCLVLITLGVSNRSNAQEIDRKEKTVYVEIFANQEQPPIFFELMDKTRTALLKYGASLSVIPDQPELEDWLDQKLIVTVYDHNQSKAVLISSLASKNYELPMSSILYPNFVTPFCCHGGMYVLFNDFSLDQNNLNNITDYITGLGLFQVGDYKGCEQILSATYKIVPLSSLGRTFDGVQSYINFYRANCAIMRDDLKMAADLLEASKPRETGEVAVNLAWIWIQLGEPDKALQLVNPIEFGKDWDFLKRRAQLYNLAFRYDDAITDLTTAIELSPNDPALYTLRGQTYLLLYEWDNVLADYNKALELDPTYANAYFYRGVLKYSVLQTGSSLYPEALADFQKYLELEPNGDHATDATRYATDIQTQLTALNN
jgi:tetratricopeptide (TPR) repeat protein